MTVVRFQAAERPAVMSNVSINRVKSELMKVSESQYECDYLVTSFPFHHIKLVTDLLAYDQ